MASFGFIYKRGNSFFEFNSQHCSSGSEDLKKIIHILHDSGGIVLVILQISFILVDQKKFFSLFSFFKLLLLVKDEIKISIFLVSFISSFFLTLSYPSSQDSK